MTTFLWGGEGTDVIMSTNLLDSKIYKDIEELLDKGEISTAIELGVALCTSITKLSSKGLPGYFCGNRKAKTVVINLNPGISAKKCDELWAEVKDRYINKSTDDFVRDFLIWRHDFGINDIDPNDPSKLRYDEFDVKQAAFLKSWKNNGINLPSDLDWNNRADCIVAKTRVLSDKLQLELIPYASSKFSVNRKHIHLFRPYIDILLDEIFSEERQYIIFASAIFEKIFEDYNQAYPGTFDLSGHIETSDPLKPGGKLRGKCKVISITYKGKTNKALIAHTFASRGLCRAFNLMQKYGEFCYELFIGNQENKEIINYKQSKTMGTLLKKLFAKTQEVSSIESKKQKIRIEFDIEEHDYQAHDADDGFIGDSYAYNGDSGIDNLEIYVDDEPLDDDILEDYNTEYTDYKKEVLSWDGEEEEVAFFGYVCCEQHHVYEFETENFDFNKLVFKYDCYDVIFEEADYSAEEHRVSVLYDGNELENLQEHNGDGDFEQEWARYDDEDEDCSYEDVETMLNEKYDKVFKDGGVFSVQLNEKWGIVDSNGNELISPRYDWMGDEFVEDVSIVGIDGVGIGYVNNEGVEIVSPKYSQARDFDNGFAAVYYGGKWGFIDKTGNEVIPAIYDDVNNFEDGRAEVKLNGETFFVDTEGQRIGAKTESDTDVSDFEIKSLDTDKLWADVISRLPADIQANVSAPSGRAYFFIKSKNGPKGVDDFNYVVNYYVRASKCAVNVETLNGGESEKKKIQKYIDQSSVESFIKEIEPQQGSRNKNKWAWFKSEPLAGKTYGDLVQWYVDTIVDFYRFFEMV